MFVSRRRLEKRGTITSSWRKTAFTFIEERGTELTGKKRLNESPTYWIFGKRHPLCATGAGEVLITRSSDKWGVGTADLRLSEKEDGALGGDDF